MAHGLGAKEIVFSNPIHRLGEEAYGETTEREKGGGGGGSAIRIELWNTFHSCILIKEA